MNSNIIEKNRATNLKKSIFNFIKYPLTPTVIGFIVIFTFFALAKPKLFLNLDTFASILSASAELGIIALGAGFLMISGEFDLSVGSIFGFCSMTMATLINGGIPVILSVFIVLIASIIIGLINGLITIKGHIPSFICTLGIGMFVRGVMLLRSGGWSVRVDIPENIVLKILGTTLGNSFFRASLIWMIILVLLIFIVSNWTKFGSNVFATGGNKIAAKYMGIKVDKIKIICFAICSFFAGFAGVLNVSRFKLADPTVGTGLELEAITAAVIGGILLSGGYGNIIGVVIGSILISTIRSGLIIIGVPGYFYTGVLGIVLVITALINNTIINKTFKREFL